MCRYCLILVLCVNGIFANNVCNNKNISINCEEGKTLQIDEAYFGYINCENLDQNDTESEKCIFSVTTIIQKNCHKQNNCQFSTSLPELELTDLCSDFNRTNLSVNYTCQETKKSDAVTTQAPVVKNISTTTSKPKSVFGCGINTCRVYCAPGCQRTCFNNYIYKCTAPCIPYGCRCREGYYRDPLNLENCIKYEHCPQMGNNTNEVYTPNGAGCQKACGSSKKYVDTCLEICEQYGTCEAGYVCKEGYQRESCFLNIFKRQYNCVKTCHSYYWCV